MLNMTEDEMVANLNWIMDNLFLTARKIDLLEKISKFQNYLYKDQSLIVQSNVKPIWSTVFSWYNRGKKKSKSKVGDPDWFNNLKEHMIAQEFFLDCQLVNGFSILTKFMHKPRDTAIVIINSLQKNNALAYVSEKTNRYKTFFVLVTSLYTKLKMKERDCSRSLHGYIRLAQEANKVILDPNHKFLTEEFINECLVLLNLPLVKVDDAVHSEDTDTKSILQFISLKRVSTPELLTFFGQPSSYDQTTKYQRLTNR